MKNKLMILCQVLSIFIFFTLPVLGHYADFDASQSVNSKKAAQLPEYYIQEGLIPVEWWTKMDSPDTYNGDTLYGGVIIVGKDETGTYFGNYRASPSDNAIPFFLSSKEAQKYYSLAVESF